MNNWLKVIGDRTWNTTSSLINNVREQGRRETIRRENPVYHWHKPTLMRQVMFCVRSRQKQAFSLMERYLEQEAQKIRQQEAVTAEENADIEQNDEYGEYTERDLSPQPKRDTKAESPTKKEQLTSFFSKSIVNVSGKTGQHTDNLKKSLLVNSQKEPQDQQEVSAKKQSIPIQAIKYKIREEPRQQEEQQVIKNPVKKDPLPARADPFAQRKPSQRTIEDLKKAIKDYQKEDQMELMSGNRQETVTSNGNVTNLENSRQNVSHLESDIVRNGSKSFKINRRNVHIQNKGALEPPVVKNHSQMKKTSEIKLNEIKVSYSQSKKQDSYQNQQQRSIDAKLKKLKREHQPRLNAEDIISKFENRGREYENALQSNIDFLVNLRKEGNKERLVRKELVNDLKINNIVRTMVNSDMYQPRHHDRQMRNFIDELKMPITKKQVKGIVRQKPFSIYHPTQKTELYKFT